MPKIRAELSSILGYHDWKMKEMKDEKGNLSFHQVLKNLIK